MFILLRMGGKVSDFEHNYNFYFHNSFSLFFSDLFKCGLCAENFSSNAALKKHHTWHKKNGGRVRGKLNTQKRLAKTRGKAVKLSVKDTKECYICKGKFTLFDNLVRHMREKHCELPKNSISPVHRLFIKMARRKMNYHLDDIEVDERVKIISNILIKAATNQSDISK